MTTAIFLSNRFDVLTSALTSVLDQVSGASSLFNAPPVIIVPSKATADYLAMKICELRSQEEYVGVIAKLKFINIAEFIDMMLQSEVHILKRNVIYAALIDLAKAHQLPDVQLDADGSLSENLLMRLEARAMQIEKVLYANTHATQKNKTSWKSFTCTGYGQQIRQILDFLEQRYKFSLPFDILQKKKGTIFNFMPKNVFWFDPEPLGRFEQDFLGSLLEQMEKEEQVKPGTHNLTIFAFSPCEGYWTDACKAGVRELRALDYSQNINDVANIDEVLPLSNWLHNHNTLVERCGRVSQCVGHALTNYLVDLGVKDVPLFLPFQPKNLAKNTCFNAQYDGQQLTALQQMQKNALLLRTDTDGIALDQSLQIRAFETPREIASWVADEILQILNNNSDAIAEDIAILVPQACASNYAAFLQSALMLRHIPVNIRGIMNTSQTSCFDALDALIPLLHGQFTRTTVLNWMFLPAIIEDEFKDYVDELIHWIDRHGIFHDINNETRHESDYLRNDPQDAEAFTWEQGFKRIALGFAHDRRTIDAQFPELDESIRPLCIRWIARVRALIQDLKTLQDAKLSWSDWQAVLYTFLDAWINTDSKNRDEEMRMIHSVMHSTWPSYRFNVSTSGDLDASVDQEPLCSLQDILPFIKITAGKLCQSYTGQMLGGVQIHPLTGDARTSRYVFMLALENESFPSKTPRKPAFERFSRYDIDANAFLKWFNNATDRLYLCGRLLSSGERDRIKQEGMPFEEIKRHLAQRSAIFLSDILNEVREASDIEAYKLIPEVKEPIDRTRIDALKQIKKNVQRMIKLNNTEDNESVPSVKVTADWTAYKKYLEAETYERLRQQIYKQNTQPSPEIYKHNNTDEKCIIDIQLKDFEKFLDTPRDTYRNIRFRVNMYLDELPSSMRHKISEPFEALKLSGHFETFNYMKELVANSLIHFQNAQSALDEVACEYDNIIQSLKAQGAFPAGFYSKRQREVDLAKFENIFKQVETRYLEPQHGFVYMLDRDSRVTSLNLLNPPDWDKGEVRLLDPIVIETAKTRYQFKGRVARFIDSQTMIFTSTSTEDVRINAVLMLCVFAMSGVPLPTQLLFVDVKAGEVKIYNLPNVTGDDARSFMRQLVELFDTAQHEFSINSKSSALIFNTKDARLDINKFVTSELYKYAGQNDFVPQSTLDVWQAFFEANAQFLRICTQVKSV